MTTSPGQQILDDTPVDPTTGEPVAPTVTTGGNGSAGIFLGVASGSDLEQLGFQTSRHVAHAFGVGLGPSVKSYKKPLYKTGYVNSQRFNRELQGNNPDVVYFYQQRLFDAGLLDTFTPGQLDKPTRLAFKDLMSQANQSSTTWQSALQSVEATGGKVKRPTARDPLTVTLSNTDDIKAVVRQVGNNLYGGQLPENTVASIADEVHARERTAQEQAYALQPTGGTMEFGRGIGAGGQVTADALKQLAAEKTRQDHPNEVGARQFADAFDGIMGALTSNQSGYKLQNFT